MKNKKLEDEEVEAFRKMMENAETTVLSPEAFDRLQELINNPPDPSPALIELMTSKPRWVKR